MSWCLPLLGVVAAVALFAISAIIVEKASTEKSPDSQKEDSSEDMF